MSFAILKSLPHKVKRDHTLGYMTKSGKHVPLLKDEKVTLLQVEDIDSTVCNAVKNSKGDMLFFLDSQDLKTFSEKI